MEENATLLVSAAVVRNGDRFLIAKRSNESRFPGRWEFPGGKVNRDESLSESLEREMLEEMGVNIRVGSEIGRIAHREEREEIILVAFECEIVSGTVEDIECDSHAWVTLDEALTFDLLEPDRKLVLRMLESAGKSCEEDDG